MAAIGIDRQRAIDIDKERALDHLLDLLSIEGLSGHEGNVATAVRQKLVDAGCKPSWLRHDDAHRHLSDQFADHGRTGPLERAYQAIVWGRPRQIKGTIDAPLGRGADRTKRAVKREDADDAREAITHYEVVERYGETEDGTSLASLVECHLETGRTHQIRVHMAHIGHPLIGDPEYGAAFKTKANRLPDAAKKIVNGFRRQALHAFLLQFEHPSTGETMHFEAPPPADLEQLIAALRTMDEPAGP